jgi:tetratricopeptide (TPR) repeat protein
MRPRNLTIQRILAFALCFWWLPLADNITVAAQEHDHPVPEKLGTVSFPISCSPSIQKEFERAMALLHSFAYSAAEKAFRELIAKDPSCAMAHWGVAMTWVHPLWEPYLTSEDAARGRAELEQAKLLGGSERERGFINALATLYGTSDATPYRERANAYTLAMAKLAKDNPNDVECQVFYALALIATASPSDKSHANEKKAAGILEPLYQKFPDHPGIPHYLIHACDNAEMASRAVPAAHKYSEIAPSAPHALHMPSHIYTRLGMWERSIASNLAARKAAHDQGDIGEELHAMDYLTYAYLQIGGADQAERVVQDLRTMSNLHANEFKVGYAASAMPVRFAMERRQWGEAARLEPIAGAQPQVMAITLWARAVGLARSGKAAAARQDVEDLKAAHEKLRATGEDYWATQVHVLWKEALAWIAHAEGRENDAIKLMRDAADQDDSVEKRPVTPGAILPAREQLGDLFLELNLPKDALPEFERALTMTPQRRASVMGRDRAQELVNTGGKSEAD